VVAAITFGALKGVTNDGTEAIERRVGGGEVRAEQGQSRLSRPAELWAVQATARPERQDSRSASVDESDVVSVTPTAPPEPEITPEPTPEPKAALTGVEAAICAYPWECSIALRVARCESGPDYEAGFNASGHGGTFQISPIHAWRFAARGLDFWIHAVVLEWNLEVAYEIYVAAGYSWRPWTCF
jgi:hypothetical protein